MGFGGVLGYDGSRRQLTSPGPESPSACASLPVPVEGSLDSGQGQSVIVAARTASVCILLARPRSWRQCPSALGAAHLRFLVLLGRRGWRRTFVSRATSDGLGQKQGTGFPSCVGGQQRSPSQGRRLNPERVLCSRAGLKPPVTALRLLVTRNIGGLRTRSSWAQKPLPTLRELRPVQTLCRICSLIYFVQNRATATGRGLFRNKLVKEHVPRGCSSSSLQSTTKSARPPVPVGHAAVRGPASGTPRQGRSPRPVLSSPVQPRHWTCAGTLGHRRSDM